MNLFLSFSFESFLEFFKNFANDNKILIMLITIFLPFLEALIPMLPLVGIVGFNMSSCGSIYGSTLGAIIGLILSIIGSILGMFFVFIIIRDLIGKRFLNKIKDKKKVLKTIEWIENRSNTSMILFLSNPYVPTSIINYAMALTGYSTKKYLIIIIVSRIICVSLLGTLGLIFNIGADPLAILWICLIYVAIYIIIWLIKKYIKIKKEKENEKNN